MISWNEIEKHLPDEYDDERHEVLRHEIKWYEYEIKDLEDEIKDLEEQLEPYKLDIESLESVESQIENISNKMNDEIKKIETKYDKLIIEKLDQIEQLRIEIDELSKCRDNETFKLKSSRKEKINKLTNQDEWGRISTKIDNKLSKVEDLKVEMEPVLDEFFKYERMVNLVELDLTHGWKEGNIIRRYDLEFDSDGPKVVGLTHGMIVGYTNSMKGYLWRRLKKKNGELIKKVEEFEGIKYEKVADSYEEYMEEFGHLYM